MKTSEQRITNAKQERDDVPILRPIIKYHGGDYYTKHAILAMLPRDHEMYVEGCGGGANVLTNKRRSRVEVYNDLYWPNWNLFDTCSLVSNAKKLRALLVVTPYNEGSFEHSKREHSRHGLVPSTSVDDRVEKAFHYLCAKRMSRGGIGKSFAWSERLRGGQPGDKNAWETFVANVFPAVCDRLIGVTCTCADVVLFLRHKYSGVGASGRERPITHARRVWYIDPPYIASTRKVKNVYDVEMPETAKLDDADVDERQCASAGHRELLKACDASRDKIVLASYVNPLYEGALSPDKWRRVDVRSKCAAGQRKELGNRVERFYLNYDPPSSPLFDLCKSK